MRPRDDNKTEAIFEATIQLLNEIGFAETSIAKIAKKANVSAATIYIHFENKEDMLLKTYLKVKKKMSEKLLRGWDQYAPVKDRFELVIKNYVEFVLDHKDYFLFIEQIMNSPLPQKWCLEESNSLFKPIYDLFETGKKQKLLKQEEVNLLITYSMFPIAQLAKEYFKGSFHFDEMKLDTIIQMSWDAIKA